MNLLRHVNSDAVIDFITDKLYDANGTELAVIANMLSDSVEEAFTYLGNDDFEVNES